ncbi:GNAT family N-acetyltransferase [Ornithinimicrobium sp. W1665]|uniref:GNAT family N-acetyltransferase n=1 Tax=Ornithinimicrobium sp. W1665 TaxID=3416666 RepID=UPI003CF8AF38
MPDATTPDATPSDATTPDATPPDATTPQDADTRSPGSPVVRPATPEDHETVGRILVTAYGPSGMPPEQSYWEELRDTAARAGDPGSEVWVAELDEQVVGTVTWAGHGSGQREVASEDEAEFRMLAVDPSARARGVGRALLDAVVARARRDGYAAVAMSSDGWMAAAHRMYEQAGFVRVPERDWSPVPGVDLLVYRLALLRHTPPPGVPDRN